MELDKITKRLLQGYRNIPNNHLLDFIEQIYEEHRSLYFFPGDICSFYPEIREYHSRVERHCYFSGAPIMPGSLYCCYRPFLENLTTGKKYVLKRTIQTEPSYQDLFPTTLSSIEDFAYKLSRSYEISDPEIDYYQLSRNIGDHLELLELGSKKKVKK